MRLFPATPPPGPFRAGFWRSPLRGRWLTSVFGAALLVGIPVLFVTGLLSYAAYNPELGNDLTPDKGVLGFYLFDWPTRPVWLYAANQGIHVIGGLALFPVLLAKLWSVIPRLFAWPPLTSPAQALERLGLLQLVGGALFEFVTGIMNVQYWYAFGFSFYTAHLYGAWVFFAGFALHVAVKLPLQRRVLRSRRIVDELKVKLADTRPEGDHADDSLVASQPAAPTLSRRGLFAIVGGSSLALVALSIGQVLGGPLRSVALLAPRGRSYGDGPNDFQVNKPAAAAGVTQDQVGTAYRLELRGGTSDRDLAREGLLALPQHTYDLPIACVEGWTTWQTWTGVRLRDLAAFAGAEGSVRVFVESVQERGVFSNTVLSEDQVADEQSLLALKVNGADLSLDHGFPARVIVPANPGVHNTKWVKRLTFGTA